MTSLIALFALGAGQQKHTTALVYPSLPTIESAGVDNQAAPVMEFQSHGVIGHLSKSSIRYETVSIWKNTSENAGEVVVRFAKQIDGSAVDLGSAVTLTKGEQSVPESNVDRLINVGLNPWLKVTYEWRFEIRPKATLGVKTSVNVPVTALGIDLEERKVAYNYGSGDLPRSGISYSVKFGKDTVFRVIDASPGLRNWQVGTAGAHLRLQSAGALPQNRIVSLRYYPGGFSAANPNDSR